MLILLNVNFINTNFLKTEQENGVHVETNGEVGTPGANVIKLFTVIYYCYFVVLLSMCAKSKNYFGNYSEMAVYYHDILQLIL